MIFIFAILIYALSAARMLWVMRYPPERDECGLEHEFGTVMVLVFFPGLNTVLAVWSMKRGGRLED